MNFVLDASIAVAWCFEDEGGDYVLAVLDALRTSESVVASHWPLEVSNALLSAERRKRIDSGSAARFIRLLLSLPIAVDPVTRGRAFRETRQLARTHGLTSYDAAYLELAIRLGVPLATLDAPLSAVTRAISAAASRHWMAILRSSTARYPATQAPRPPGSSWTLVRRR